MHPLNHGSMCPTSGVAIARYTRGSMEDGPGVSINRTGGWSSPTCCVMRFCPSLILALDSRLRISNRPRMRSWGLFLPWREPQFSRNPYTHATDKLARSVRRRPLDRRGWTHTASNKQGQLIPSQVLRHHPTVNGIQAVLESARLRRIRFSLDHRCENEFQEPIVRLQCRRVVGGKRSLDCFFRCGRHEFQPAHKHAYGLRRPGMDGKWQDFVHERRGNDVQQPASLLKPGASPGFDHGVRFVLIEALGNQDSFQIPA